MSTLLLGMGNPILSDDAVGVRLATDFAARLGSVPGLKVITECSVGGLNLLDALAGHERAIVLDSVWTAGGTPGDWYHFDATALGETMNLAGIHDVNFATALELGRRLGHDIPAPSAIDVFAVEVKDVSIFSQEMTPELEARYPAFAEAIFRAVLTLLGGIGPALTGAWPAGPGDAQGESELPGRG